MSSNHGFSKQPNSRASKTGVLRASHSFVGLTSYDIPHDMVENIVRKYAGERTPRKCVLQGHGIVLESNSLSHDDSEGTYLSLIIAPAMLFKRTNGVLPHQVQFDVCLPDSKVYKEGKLVACDFHYNLAAITIETSFRLRPATLAFLNDVFSIDPQNTSQSLVGQDANPFQLHPHRELFNVSPGTDIIYLRCSFSPPFSVTAVCGVFRSFHFRSYSCKELYWVTCAGVDESYSGIIINLFGEVLGIMFCGSSFLPSNFVSKWWSHYKHYGKFCRPWVGVEVANLAEANLRFLEKFKNTFSDINTGVIVTEVEKDTPAYWSGIRLKDVIVKCAGKQVKSKIQFFESMWDNAGNSVELTILRASDGQQLDLRMSIGEANPTNFYRWNLPVVTELPWSGCSDDEVSDDDALST